MPREGLRLARNPLARSVWMLLGHACVAIGTIGAYVPGLPTVSFYVLAATFYARGSEKFYNWLLHHRQRRHHGACRRPGKTEERPGG